MEISTGDLLYMKKKHPCGGQTFQVLRAGTDLRIRCCVCGHEILIEREKAEKMIKRTTQGTALGAAADGKEEHHG